MTYLLSLSEIKTPTEMRLRLVCIGDKVSKLSKRNMAIFIRSIRSSLNEERLLVFS